jgi:hypothetical protein
MVGVSGAIGVIGTGVTGSRVVEHLVAIKLSTDLVARPRPLLGTTTCRGTPVSQCTSERC